MKRGEAALDLLIIEAEENFLIDWQFLVLDLINAKGISRSELAKRAGISKARLSQILCAEANPTIKTFARLFHALGVKVVPRAAQLANEQLVPLQPDAEDGWQVGQPSEPVRAKRNSTSADDWLGASNDNYMSVDSDARSFLLKAA